MLTAAQAGRPDRARLPGRLGSVSRSLVVASLHADAAPQRPWVQAGAYSRLAQPLQNSLEQVQVHPADQLGVFLGESMERAVVQDDVAAREPWLEAVDFEQAHQGAGFGRAGLLSLLWLLTPA